MASMPAPVLRRPVDVDHAVTLLAAVALAGLTPREARERRDERQGRRRRRP